MSDTVKQKDSDGNAVRVLSDEITTRNGSAVSDSNVQAQVIKLATGGDGVANDFDLTTLATQTTLAALKTSVDTLRAQLPAALAGGKLDVALADLSALATASGQSTANTTLASILTSVDGVEALLAAIQALLTTEGGYLDGVETLLGHLTDGTAQVIYAPPASASTASVAGVTSAATLKAAQSARRGLYIFNDSTAILYVKLGSAASTTDYTVQLAAGGFYELPAPFYRGIVTGVWAAANGNARVTELV